MNRKDKGEKIYSTGSVRKTFRKYLITNLIGYLVTVNFQHYLFLSLLIPTFIENSACVNTKCRKRFIRFRNLHAGSMKGFKLLLGILQL